jgi:hypothetical protein
MCHISSDALKADGVTLATALKAISGFIDDPTTKTSLLDAANALTAATSTWDGSENAKNILDTAASSAESILHDIPTTASIAPWVAIAVSALDVIIANVGNPPEPTTVAQIRGTVSRIQALPPNPHRDKASVIHTGNLRKDFIDAWNNKVDEIPMLPVPKLNQ